MKLKILSYNLHKGISLFGTEATLKEIKPLLAQQQLDVVFLQEVRGSNVELSTSQFEYLADNLWPHYTYGSNARSSWGHHGNSILSRFPFRFAQNNNLSTNRFEKRGLLHGIIEVSKTQHIHVLCIHLDLREKGRREQVQKITQYILDFIPDDHPMLICGDSNDWRQRISKDLFEAHGLQEVFQTLQGEHAKTFPSALPWLMLDRIYYRGLTPIEAKVFSKSAWKKLSDHLPLYAEFEIPE